MTLLHLHRISATPSNALDCTSVTDTSAAVRTDLQDLNTLSFVRSEAVNCSEASKSSDSVQVTQGSSTPSSSKLTVPLLLSGRIANCTGEIDTESEGVTPVSILEIEDTVILGSSSSSSGSKAIDSTEGRQSAGEISHGQSHGHGHGQRAGHSAIIYPVGSAMQFARNKH